jgi:four helix bundle protein
MLQLSHKKLDVYRESLLLADQIYKLTSSFPREELYTLTSQLRRATISLPSNIAEGASRKSPREKLRFFDIARSSLVEIDTQIELAILQQYLNSESQNELSKRMNIIFAMLTNLIRSIEKKL